MRCRVAAVTHGDDWNWGCPVPTRCSIKSESRRESRCQVMISRRRRSDTDLSRIAQISNKEISSGDSGLNGALRDGGGGRGRRSSLTAPGPLSGPGRREVSPAARESHPHHHPTTRQTARPSSLVTRPPQGTDRRRQPSPFLATRGWDFRYACYTVMLSTRTSVADGDGARGSEFEQIPSCGRCPGRPSHERCHAHPLGHRAG